MTFVTRIGRDCDDVGQSSKYGFLTTRGTARSSWNKEVAGWCLCVCERVSAWHGPLYCPKKFLPLSISQLTHDARRVWLRPRSNEKEGGQKIDTEGGGQMKVRLYTTYSKAANWVRVLLR